MTNFSKQLKQELKSFDRRFDCIDSRWCEEVKEFNTQSAYNIRKATLLDIKEKIEEMKLGKPKLSKTHCLYERVLEDNEVNDQALQDLLKEIENAT